MYSSGHNWQLVIAVFSVRRITLCVTLCITFYTTRWSYVHRFELYSVQWWADVLWCLTDWGMMTSLWIRTDCVWTASCMWFTGTNNKILNWILRLCFPCSSFLWHCYTYSTSSLDIGVMFLKITSQQSYIKWNFYLWHKNQLKYLPVRSLRAHQQSEKK